MDFKKALKNNSGYPNFRRSLFYKTNKTLNDAGFRLLLTLRYCVYDRNPELSQIRITEEEVSGFFNWASGKTNQIFTGLLKRGFLKRIKKGLYLIDEEKIANSRPSENSNLKDRKKHPKNENPHFFKKNSHPSENNSRPSENSPGVNIGYIKDEKGCGVEGKKGEEVKEREEELKEKTLRLTKENQKKAEYLKKLNWGQNFVEIYAELLLKKQRDILTKEEKVALRTIEKDPAYKKGEIFENSALSSEDQRWILSQDYEKEEKEMEERRRKAEKWKNRKEKEGTITEKQAELLQSETKTNINLA